jgi:hypothetical protein
MMSGSSAGTESTAANSEAAGAPIGLAASSTSASLDANVVEELEETVSRLFSHPGVQAVIILNKAGDVLVERTTAALRRASSTGADDNNIDAAALEPQQQHVLPKRLNQVLQSVRGLLRALPDPQQHGSGAGGSDDDDELGFLQIRSADGGREIMVAPHRGYVLAVMKMAASDS